MLDSQSLEFDPIVSVIMPCYNQGQYIDEAVNSVLNQTFQGFEVIIINDGSTDSFTIEHLKSFDQPKIRVIHTDNQGVAAARNRGIQEAKGRYLLPLDADDCITPIYLEKAIPILENQPNVGIVYGQGELFGDYVGFWNLPDYQFPEILLTNVIFNSAIFRKADWQKVGGYRSNMVYGLEDYDFWLYLIEMGREIVRLPEVVYLYRQRSNSRNHNLQVQLEQHVQCYAQLFRNHPQLYTDNIETLFRSYLNYQAQAQNYQTCKVELSQVSEQIQQIQAKLFATQAELVTTQTQLNQTQVELTQTQTQLHCTQAELGAELGKAQTTIAWMESSRFWKLRNAFLSFKRKLGL